MGIAGCGMGCLVEVNQTGTAAYHILYIHVLDWEAILWEVMLEVGTEVYILCMYPYPPSQ